MKYLLYCINGYDSFDNAIASKHNHLYWFNPKMICTVKSYSDEKLAYVKTVSDSFWCNLGEWETIIDKVHNHFCRPNDVRIQEVVVMK